MKWFLVTFLVLPLLGNSQLLDNSNGHAFGELPFFNETFIKNNQIKELKGTYTYKKLDDIMRPSNYIYRYEFDQEGHLIRSLETRKGVYGTDSLVLFYGYDVRGNLAYVRKKDNHGYWSTHFEYDSLKRKIKETYRRDIDTAGTLLVPFFERSTVLSFETYTYKQTGNQLKKTTYNNYGFPYKEEISYLDSAGFVINKESKLKMTSEKTTTYYGYNANGWISKITVENESNPTFNSEVFFKYDTFGNLIEKQVYENGKHITEIQLIYNTKDGLISSILIRDVKTSLITILRFEEIKFQ
ncbi:MAG: hypothetical protein E6Q37_02820 [Crocinitomicaceae bacterium]|nr:MAG: hypothetical protein E6Q37_02820 [Crocinitomicaceae bacterium]